MPRLIAARSGLVAAKRRLVDPPVDPGLGVPGDRPEFTSKPGPSDTGPRFSMVDSMTGPEARSAAAANGGLLERVSISGLTLRDNNTSDVGLTFRDCIIDGGYGSYAANCHSFGGTPVPGERAVFEYCEIKNADSSSCLSFDARFLRCNIHHGIDLVKAFNNTEIYACWMHDLYKFEGAHCDVTQIVSGTGILVHFNNMEGFVADDNAYQPGTTVSGVLQTGSVTGAISAQYLDNWVNGGGYTLRGPNTDDAAAHNVEIIFRRNKHGRDFGFGPITQVNNGNCSYDSSNVWEDDGTPVLGG